MPLGLFGHDYVGIKTPGQSLGLRNGRIAHKGGYEIAGTLLLGIIAAAGEAIYHLPREGGKARVPYAWNAAVGVGSSLTVEAEIEYVADFETVAKDCHVTVRGH
jgi:hypothetical protein